MLNTSFLHPEGVVAVVYPSSLVPRGAAVGQVGGIGDGLLRAGRGPSPWGAILASLPTRAIARCSGWGWHWVLSLFDLTISGRA